MTKKKILDIPHVEPQLQPVLPLPLNQSLQQMSLEQLFELFKIIVEIEESEDDIRAYCQNTPKKRVLH